LDRGRGGSSEGKVEAKGISLSGDLTRKNRRSKDPGKGGIVGGTVFKRLVVIGEGGGFAQ